MIAITENEMRIILEIIQTNAADCTVLAFGSRYKGNFKAHSDLDLAFIRKDGKQLGLVRTSEISFAFASSDLPYAVDVIDYNGVSDEFKAIINQGNLNCY